MVNNSVYANELNTLNTNIIAVIQSQYAVVCNARFHHQEHLDFFKHWTNV